MSSKAAEKRLQKLFKDFDKDAEHGYDMSDLQQMKDDIRSVFQEISKKFSENKLGSERSDALLNAVKQRIPQLYTELMERYRSQAKK